MERRPRAERRLVSLEIAFWYPAPGVFRMNAKGKGLREKDIVSA
jgi:hypothetical protein